jgi:hypothetical protein
MSNQKLVFVFECFNRNRHDVAMDFPFAFSTNVAQGVVIRPVSKGFISTYACSSPPGCGSIIFKGAAPIAKVSLITPKSANYVESWAVG